MKILVKENAKPGLDLYVEPFGFSVNNDEKFIVINYRRWMETSDGQKVQVETTAEKVRNIPAVTKEVPDEDNEGQLKTVEVEPAKPNYDNNFSAFAGDSIFQKINEFVKSINQ